jgi:hypothetical protein
MPKWEYKVTRLSAMPLAAHGDFEPRLQNALVGLGDDGWEMCASIPDDGGETFFVFKRPK